MLAKRKTIDIGRGSHQKIADPYVDVGSRGHGEVAELAASRKVEKYSCVPSSYLFQPIALENVGSLNCSAHDFVKSWAVGFQ